MTTTLMRMNNCCCFDDEATHLPKSLLVERDKMIVKSNLEVILSQIVDQREVALQE